MIAYLSCELAARDLDARLLIASHLLKAGETVVIGQYWSIGYNLPTIPPGVVLFASCNHIQADVMARAKDARHAVCFTDEEALALEASRILDITDEKAVALADTFFFQTKQHEELVKGKYPAVRGRLAGNVRVELLRNSALYKEKVSALRQKGNYILLNTNFTLLNSVWNVNDPDSEEGQEHQANFATTKKVLQWLLAEHRGHRIVVRPHPAENAETWRLMGVPEVVTGEAAVPWMAGASLVIHPGSTTGLEAALMGVPTVNIGLPNPRFIFNTASYRTSDAAEAISAIDAFLRDRTGPIATFKPKLPYYPIDAAKTIARQILKLGRAMPPPASVATWGRITRSEVQTRKFSVTAEQFTQRANIFCRYKRMTQLDDSVFVLEPFSS